MPCLPIIETTSTGKRRRVGILCVGNEPVEVEHGGRTYLFEWTAASGYCAVNKDGSERLSRVPNAVWDKVSELRKRCSLCGVVKFTQEIARTETRTTTMYRTKRDAAKRINPVKVETQHIVCLECAETEPNAEAEVKIGQVVWTQTTSGEVIRCTVVDFEDGEVLLDSPAHGYIIRRHARELSTKAKEADK